jgi:ubiquinone/menaquinone biosynthesis C-methylase UbiE
MHLPKRDNIQPTEIADPLKFYYLPFTRIFFIKRLALVNAMIKENTYDTLLDIGCGSGIFLKELKNRCNNLYAIDVHRKMHLVQDMIKKEGINVNLTEASVIDLPYDSETFDCVISVSVLEHIRELDKALHEICRVAKRNAIIVLAFPVENRITDIILRFAYTLLPNVKLEDEHVSKHSDIIHAANKIFKSSEISSYPSYIPLDYSSYCVYKTTKQG